MGLSLGIVVVIVKIRGFDIEIVVGAMF
jgi:hypothetical protein